MLDKLYVYLFLYFIIVFQNSFFMKNLIANYAHYNLWANQRLINVLKQLKETQLNQDIASSFPSLRLTLLHIWDAELIWLGRLKGESMTEFPSKKFTGTIDDIYKGLENTSTELANFAKNQAPEFFDKMCSYATTTGQNHQQSIGEIILHIVNHGSYHRGQVITMARQIGMDKFPPLDYIWFIRG